MFTLNLRYVIYVISFISINRILIVICGIFSKKISDCCCVRVSGEVFRVRIFCQCIVFIGSEVSFRVRGIFMCVSLCRLSFVFMPYDEVLLIHGLAVFSFFISHFAVQTTISIYHAMFSISTS